MTATRAKQYERQRSANRVQKGRKRLAFGAAILACGVAVATEGPTIIHDLRHPSTNKPDTIEHTYTGRPYVANNLLDSLITKEAGTRGQLLVQEHSNGTVQASILGADNKKDLTVNLRCTPSNDLEWYKAKQVGDVGSSVGSIALSHEVDIHLYTDSGSFGKLVCEDGTANIYSQLYKVPRVPSLPAHNPIQIPAELNNLIG